MRIFYVTGTRVRCCKAAAILMLMFIFVQVSAAAYPQRIDLSVQNAPLEKVLKELHRQSGFLFLYNGELLRKARPVTMAVKQAPLEEVLKKCFEDQPFTYELSEKTILVKYRSTDWAEAPPAPLHISGKITDEQGNPLSGVTITVKGSGTTAVTNADGVYTITLSRGAGTLQFAYVGFATQEKEVKSGSGIVNIVLIPQARDLEEVVIAYGSVKNKQLTNSVAQISSKDIEKRPISNMTTALVGAAPGIQTNAGSGQPGAGPAIRIRGFGSVTGDNSPLFVIDGGIYDGALNSISPDDIESITVLKDASASALYGARAANGVIIVTTKKGKKNTNVVNVRATQGFVTRGLSDYETVNAYEYYPLLWESYRNFLLTQKGATTTTMPLADANQIASGLYTRFTSGTNVGLQNYNGTAYTDISQKLVYNPFNVAGSEIVGVDGKINPNAQIRPEYDDLDWNKAVRRTGVRNDYVMSYSGGTDKNNYYVSLNYLKETGFSIGSDFNRVTGRVKLNSQPKKWFNTGINIAGTLSKTKTANEDGGIWENPFYPSLIFGPIYPVYQHDATTGAVLLDGEGNRLFDKGDLRPIAPGRNVVAETQLNDLWNKRNLLSGRAFTEIKFLKDFKFTTNLNLDVNTYNYNRYRNKTIGDMVSVGGRSTITTSNSQWVTLNELLNYNKTIGKHSIDVLLGHENYNYTYSYLNAVGENQIVEGSTELANFSSYKEPNSYTDKYKTEGYFSRLQYSYGDRYSFMASFRRDGSSKFYEDVRWGNFWSVGASWQINNERFFKVNWIDALKLRASYGQVGSDGVSGYYPWQSLYDVGYSNGNEAGIKQNTSVGNKELKWESNNSYDVALEFGVLKNRVSGTLEYFHRESNNLLFSMPLPVSTGLSTVPVNYGSMYNEGVEIQLTGEVIRRKNFNWTATVNWTTFANKITNLPFGKRVNGTKQWEVGHSMYDFYLRRYAGVDAATGSELYEALDATASGVVVNDKGVAVTTSASNAKYDYAGKATPDFYGSIKNTFSYKRLTLDFTFIYSVGGKVFDADYQSLMHNGTDGRAIHKDALMRWTPEHTITNVPKRITGTTMYDSDRWLTDGSYLNFRTISLTYAFPKKMIEKLTLNTVNVYVSGENLFILSKRKGLDPTQTFTGAPSYTYAPARVISMGINVGF